MKTLHSKTLQDGARKRRLTCQDLSSHEVGHLFGARHNSCSDYLTGCDNSPLPYHGYEFEIDHWVPCFDVPPWCVEKSFYRTVMAYQKSSLDPSIIIPYFSNGNSCYTAFCHTVGVGDHQHHDNASIIGNNYPIVVGYYNDGTIPFNIDFNVFGPDCIPGDGGEEVIINCGKPPYTIQWYSSFNGTYWNPLSTITTSSNVAFRSINSAIHRYYKVIVTDALGNSLTSSDSYSPPVNCSDIHKQLSQDKNNSQGKILDRLEVFPNPNNGTFMLNINSSTDEYAIYKIVNNLGQQLYKDNLALKKGNNSFELKFNNLPIGYYILNLSSSTINQNKPLIIE